MVLPAAEGYHRYEEEGCPEEENRAQGQGLILTTATEGVTPRRWEAGPGLLTNHKNNGVSLTPPHSGGSAVAPASHSIDWAPRVLVSCALERSKDTCEPAKHLHEGAVQASVPLLEPRRNLRVGD